jgi:GDP-L-fucose synthase
MSDLKVLVTGKSGLIGSNLVKRLKDDGYDVIGTSTEDGDLRDENYCLDITKDVDVVFHCAANTSGAAVMGSSPLVHVTPNIIMNANLMESSYKNDVKKFIFMSSSTVYSYTGKEPNKEDEFIYGDIYESYFAVGWMKRYTENLCELYSKHLNPNMECIVVRPSNIYGPGDKYDERSHVLPATIVKIVERQNPLVVWGNGEEVRDFIYIEDFVDACMEIMDKVHKYDIFNVGSGVGISVNEILNYCQVIEDYMVEPVYDKSKPSMIPIRLLDVSKIKETIGWESKTSIVDGLEKTIKWYKERYN